MLRNNSETSLCDVQHAARIEHLEFGVRVYELTKKHKRGGQGTEMDLPDDEAQTLLEGAIADPKSEGKTLYNYSMRTGKVYRFFFGENRSNAAVYHGFPIQPTDSIVSLLYREKIIDKPTRDRL